MIFEFHQTSIRNNPDNLDSDFYAQQGEINKDLTEVELEALTRFKKKDKQIDDLISGLIDKLDTVEQGLMETSDVSPSPN